MWVRIVDMASDALITTHIVGYAHRQIPEGLENAVLLGGCFVLNLLHSL